MLMIVDRLHPNPICRVSLSLWQQQISDRIIMAPYIRAPRQGGFRRSKSSRIT
ncbi:hypothetical protein COCNU_scaffold004199G000030 [Cocos nucifera]|nr:hypothetical protein [Cocos nucifera]